MKWSSAVKYKFYTDKVLLIVDSKWIVITKEVFYIFDNCCKNNVEFCEILKEYDIESKNYLLDIMEKLNILEAFTEPVNEYSFYLYLTDKCNLNCKHCSINAKSTSTKFNTDMDTSNIKEVINKIIKVNPSNIIITGGEPMVREDFYDLIFFLRSNYQGKISLMTNGTLIKKENAKILIDNIDNIDLSIDGIDEDSCKQIRGEGVFSKVMGSVDILHELDFNKISLSMTFGTFNHELYKSFIELNSKLGTLPIPRIFTPLGRGKTNYNKFIKEDKPLSNPIQNQEDLSIETCGAIESTLAIGNDGNIYPCSLLMKDKYILGNINSIADLKLWLENKNYLKSQGYKNVISLYPENMNRCKDCTISDFCWGCLEVTDRMLDNEEKFNSRCKFNKKPIERVVWKIQ